jgi:hypothetical protein
MENLENNQTVLEIGNIVAEMKNSFNRFTQREETMENHWRISKNCKIIKEGMHMPSFRRKHMEGKKMKKYLKQ